MSKPKSRLAIARAYKREIAKLQRQRERLYWKVLRKLGFLESVASEHYFMHDQVGYSSFEEYLR